jgi:hypothetical protein
LALSALFSMELLLSELDRQIAGLRDTTLVSGDALAGLRPALARTNHQPGTGNIPVCIALRTPPIATVMQRVG